MSIVGWILLGLVSGVFATKIVHKPGGVLLDVALGIAGAVVGGLLFNAGGAASVGFNVGRLSLGSMYVAVTGAMLALVLKQAVIDRGNARV
jgi:uncharacterized membrane protein YeaQ/YmgE (transglycosylase-associated protein family)